MLRLFDTSGVRADFGYTTPEGLPEPVHPRRGWYRPCRFAVEMMLVSVLALLAAPVILVVVVLVRLTSRGPAFYTQTRLGLNGRHYTIFKIRSMYHQSEDASGPCWSSRRDPRITPLGRILRRTHIDELPQLWNILRGDMSLVGPRPERPEFLPKLEDSIPRYRERLRVRPGVTGLAQVQLPADIDVGDVRRKQAYDLYYIAEMSPWLDLRIIVCTPLKMCGVPYWALRTMFAMPTPPEIESSIELIDEPSVSPALEPVQSS